MCGIVGIVRRDGNSVSRRGIEVMVDAVAHRGPDGSGMWTRGDAGLGHTRLAIIDPSPDSSQPMTTPDNRFILSFNGALLNFRELRSELMASGRVFQSSGDTEVVLQSLATWGKGAIERFNGMFALALWDTRERSLLLARDRYGIKPLYYQLDSQQLAFASEWKAIARLGGGGVSLDRAALSEYMTFQNILSDRTFARGIRILPAGHYAELRLTGSHTEFALAKYWDFDFREPDGQVDAREYEEELARLFEQAVRRSLVSDQEVGSYLSGGMDSASIASVAAKEIPMLKTFTCGFDLTSASGLELSFDERSRAEALSAHLGTEHYEAVLKAGDMERSLAALAWHLEDPRVGQSYPNLFAAKLASRFVKVVLSGAGGDELFGGYPWRYRVPAAGTSMDEFVRKYFAGWQRLLDPPTLNRLLGLSETSQEGSLPFDAFEQVLGAPETEPTSQADFANLSLYFECKTFLHGLLIVEDKLSMAHGLEARLPFLDNDLVDFAMTCPASLKIRNLGSHVPLDENMAGKKSEIYFQRTSDGKAILRNAMVGHVPSDAILRPKQGFSAPDASWFRGDSIEFVRRQLLGDGALIHEIFDRATVTELVEDHLSGNQNRRLLLWAFLSVEQWLKTQW